MAVLQGALALCLLTFNGMDSQGPYLPDRDLAARASSGLPKHAQVCSQLQSLLSEKAALAQENARLLRENTGLQVQGLRHLNFEESRWQ